MAKIRVKFGENEVEIDSRDFYVDNQTIGEVIGSVTKHLEENKAKIVFEDASPGESKNITNENHSSLDYLSSLDDAEVHEPEFNESVPIPAHRIREKLKLLETKAFFDEPRTVTETVEQLREYGWSASPLDVSKALTKMAFSREIIKNSQENKNYYLTKEPLLTN